MALVVCVHGIGQQYSGEGLQHERWLTPLNDGLRRAEAAPLSAAEVACAYYGDLFRPPGRRMAAADPLLGADDLDEFEAELSATPPGARVVAVALHDELQLRALSDGKLLDRHRSVGAGLRQLVGTAAGAPDAVRLVTLSENSVIEFWHVERGMSGEPDRGVRLRASRASAIASDSRFRSRLSADRVEALIVSREGTVLRLRMPDLGELAGFSLGTGNAEEALLLADPGAPPDNRLWLVDLPDGRAGLFVYNDGDVVVLTHSGDVLRTRSVDLDIEHAYEAFPVLLSGEPAVLAGGSGGSTVSTAASIMAAPKALRRRPRRYAWSLLLTAGGRWRRRHEILVPHHEAPPPAWIRSEPVDLSAHLAKGSPSGDAFVILSADSLLVLPTDREVPATTIDLGVPCVDFDFGPDGELVIATRNGVVVLDPPTTTTRVAWPARNSPKG